MTILLGGVIWDSARRPRLVNWRIPAQSSTRWRIWLYHGGAGRRQIRRVLVVEFDAASPGESIDGGKILGKRCRGRMWRRLERGKVERVWMRRKRGKRSWSRASAITSRAAVAGGGSSDGVAGAHHLATSFRGSPIWSQATGRKAVRGLWRKHWDGCDWITSPWLAPRRTRLSNLG